MQKRIPKRLSPNWCGGISTWFTRRRSGNQGRLPDRFEQAEPYWPKEIRKGTGVTADEFEILYHGSLESLTNRAVIVFREKKLWPHLYGQWGRFYALADGGVQYCSSSDKTADGNFDDYEKKHLAPTAGQ